MCPFDPTHFNQPTSPPKPSHLFCVAGVPLQDGQQESEVWVARLNCFPCWQPRQQALHVLPQQQLGAKQAAAHQHRLPGATVCPGEA
jgi:hypothetical protein